MLLGTHKIWVHCWVEGRECDLTARLGATSTAHSWPTRPQDGIRWTTGSFLNIRATFWMPTELFLELWKFLQISSHDLPDIQTPMNSSHTGVLILRRKFHVPFPYWQISYGLSAAMIYHNVQTQWHISHLFSIQKCLALFFWHDPFLPNPTSDLVKINSESLLCTISH